jgi:hypothetical protein
MTPTPTCTVAPYRGKPTLFIDGHPTPSYTYCNPLDIGRYDGVESHRLFAKHGCRTYMVAVRGGVDDDWYTTAFWTDDNVFPDITNPAEVAKLHIVRHAEAILKLCPDARLWIRFQSLTPPIRWRKKFPDELLLDSYGKRFDEPSLASDKYMEQAAAYIANVVRFCERQPWADRIIGYVAYPLGEGTTVLTCEGSLFDHSPVMVRRFRQFLRERYGSNDALRTAWHKPEASLESALPPDDADFWKRGTTRRSEVDTGQPQNKRTPHRLHWPEPEETTAERDYCLCMRELTEHYLKTILGSMKKTAPNRLAGIDAFKQTMLGWPLIPRWTGDYQSHQGLMHAVSGAFGMADMLDLPELDVVATPHDYLHRGMGFGYEGEGIGDSIVRHGKMMLMEEDQRTFRQKDSAPFNSFADPAEVEAGFWRNFASSVTRGYNTYICEMSGLGSWFTEKSVQKVLAKRKLVHEASTHWDRHEVPSVVMVVDDTSVLEEDFTIGYQDLAVIRQRMVGLSRCGVPFRLHLLEDLERDDFPTCHKVFLFPNLFKVTPERLALLRRKVFRNGNVAIFGPASGITDGSKLSAESASELTGIPLKLLRKESPRWVTVDRFNHPVTARFQNRVEFGDSYVYGPLLVPQPHPEVTRLGGIQWPTALDGAGLVIREFGNGASGNGKPGERGEGDYAAVFACAVPLPESLLRELARYSGTHVYGESDDLIFADSCTVGIHSVQPGRRTVELPKPSVVWDLIRRKNLGVKSRVIVTCKPPQTNLYYLGEDDPFGKG